MVTTYKCARCERVVVYSGGWFGGMVNDLCFGTGRSGKHEWEVVRREPQRSR